MCGAMFKQLLAISKATVHTYGLTCCPTSAEQQMPSKCRRSS
jgi:hypothetical protein